MTTNLLHRSQKTIFEKKKVCLMNELNGQKRIIKVANSINKVVLEQAKKIFKKRAWTNHKWRKIIVVKSVQLYSAGFIFDGVIF